MTAEFERLGRSPQRVRLLGIPPSHYSAVLVAADYDMKKIVADLEQVPGLTSLAEARLERMREALRTGRAPATSNTLDRFWFSAALSAWRHVQQEGIVLLRQTPVQLLTEAEFVRARGGIIGSGTANGEAAAFARRFTAVLPLMQRPIYKELAAIYRWQALAGLMEKQSAFRTAPRVLACLLDEFRVPYVPVSTTVPGITRVQELEHRTTSRRTVVRQMLCGGVVVDVGDIRPEKAPQLAAGLQVIRSRALATRPAVLTLAWDIPVSLTATAALLKR